MKWPLILGNNIVSEIDFLRHYYCHLRFLYISVSLVFIFPPFYLLVASLCFLYAYFFLFMPNYALLFPSMWKFRPFRFNVIFDIVSIICYFALCFLFVSSVICFVLFSSFFWVVWNSFFSYSCLLAIVHFSEL